MWLCQLAFSFLLFERNHAEVYFRRAWQQYNVKHKENFPLFILDELYDLTRGRFHFTFTATKGAVSPPVFNRDRVTWCLLTSAWNLLLKRPLSLGKWPASSSNSTRLAKPYATESNLFTTINLRPTPWQPQAHLIKDPPSPRRMYLSSSQPMYFNWSTESTRLESTLTWRLFAKERRSRSINVSFACNQNPLRQLWMGSSRWDKHFHSLEC